MFISLTKINDVKNFVELANRCSHEVAITSGNYSVNAKSILGVFSLDLDKPVELKICGDMDTPDVVEFMQAIKSYIVAQD